MSVGNWKVNEERRRNDRMRVSFIGRRGRRRKRREERRMKFY